MIVNIVGQVRTPYSLASHYVRAFQGLGVAAHGTPLVPMMFERSRLQKLARRYPTLIQGRGLLRAVRGAGAGDVLVLVKGQGLLQGTAGRLRRLLNVWQGPRVLIAPDHLSTFASTEHLKLWCGAGGLIGTFDPMREAAMHPEVATSIFPLGFGYDPESHWAPVPKRVDRRVTFLGTWDPNREAILRLLAAHYPIQAMGPYWGRARSSTGLDVVDRATVWGDEAAHFTNASWVSLNLLRPQNWHSENMRSYELPAQGALACQYPCDGAYPFGASARDVGSLVEAVDDIWADGIASRRERAMHGQEAVRPYSYMTRAKELLDRLCC